MTEPITSKPTYDSSVLESGTVNTNGLTADGLMHYLQDRLGSIDEQANAAFEKQQRIDGERKVIATVQNIVAQHEGASVPKDGVALSDDELVAIAAAIDQLKVYNETELVAKLEEQLYHKEGLYRADGTSGKSLGVITVQNISLLKEQLTSVKSTLDNHAKALESSASLEMIHLQSVMSARQTAVQLATNLVSALAKSQEAIAGNIGH